MKARQFILSTLLLLQCLLLPAHGSFNEHRADNLMQLLYSEGTAFFKKTQDGSLARRWKNQGISLN